MRLRPAPSWRSKPALSRGARRRVVGIEQRLKDGSVGLNWRLVKLKRQQGGQSKVSQRDSQRVCGGNGRRWRGEGHGNQSGRGCHWGRLARERTTGWRRGVRAPDCAAMGFRDGERRLSGRGRGRWGRRSGTHRWDGPAQEVLRPIGVERPAGYPDS